MIREGVCPGGSEPLSGHRMGYAWAWKVSLYFEISRLFHLECVETDLQSTAQMFELQP
jgi:hypothetical protein